MKYLHTIVKGAGLLFSMKHDRFMLATEVWEAMGFPCTQAAEDMVGAMSSLGEGEPRPRVRSHASMVAQAGNAMHVVVIGAFQLAVLLKFPSQGSTPTEDGSEDRCGKTRAFSRRVKQQKLRRIESRGSNDSTAP